jgi:Flp pilus assembly protein TadD
MALEINAALEGLFPGSSGVLLNKALILDSKALALEKTGRGAETENKETLEAYEKALSIEPVLPDALFNAAFFYMRQRDYARARDCLSLYVITGEEPDKKKQARKIIRDIDGSFLANSGFREAYDCVNRDENEEGLSKIRPFIEKYPKAWNGWFVLGWALRKIGRYSDGREALKKAAELGGTSSDVHNEAAICLMELGDLKAARKELEEALRKEPENTKIISNLGVLAQKSGKKDEAAAFFRTVLELDPDDPLARRLYERIS